MQLCGGLPPGKRVGDGLPLSFDGLPRSGLIWPCGVGAGSTVAVWLRRNHHCIDLTAHIRSGSLFFLHFGVSRDPSSISYGVRKQVRPAPFLRNWEALRITFAQPHREPELPRQHPCPTPVSAQVHPGMHLLASPFSGALKPGIPTTQYVGVRCRRWEL